MDGWHGDLPPSRLGPYDERAHASNYAWLVPLGFREVLLRQAQALEPVEGARCDPTLHRGVAAGASPS